jgi:hypothetical protein
MLGRIFRALKIIIALALCAYNVFTSLRMKNGKLFN